MLNERAHRRATLSPGSGSRRPPSRFRLPRREELADATVAVLSEGRPRAPDLLVLDLGDGPIVVKDYSKKGWLVRTVGRVEIGHECRAYRFLGAAPNIPGFVGRVDAFALAMEKIDGVQLTLAPDRFERGAMYLQRLAEVMGELRRRGFCHLDIRGRRNVFLRDDGEIVVFDLAGSFWARPGSLLHRLLRGVIDWSYWSAFLKWKVLLTPDDLTEEDRRGLRWVARLRSLRIYRRKENRGRKWPED